MQAGRAIGSDFWETPKVRFWPECGPLEAEGEKSPSGEERQNFSPYHANYRPESSAK